MPAHDEHAITIPTRFPRTVVAELDRYLDRLETQWGVKKSRSGLIRDCVEAFLKQADQTADLATQLTQVRADLEALAEADAATQAAYAQQWNYIKAVEAGVQDLYAEAQAQRQGIIQLVATTMDAFRRLRDLEEGTTTEEGTEARQRADVWMTRLEGQVLAHQAQEGR